MAIFPTFFDSLSRAFAPPPPRVEAQTDVTTNNLGIEHKATVGVPSSSRSNSRDEVRSFCIFSLDRLIALARLFMAIFPTFFDSLSRGFNSTPPIPPIPSKAGSPSPLRPLHSISGRGGESYKSLEQGLNLSRSWHKGHSHDLQYPVLYLSRIQRIWWIRIFELVFQHRLKVHFIAQRCRYHVMILGTINAPILTHLTSGNLIYRHFPAWILA